MPLSLRQLFTVSENEVTALNFLRAQGLLRQDGPYCTLPGCPKEMTLVKIGRTQSNRARFTWRRVQRFREEEENKQITEGSKTFNL